MLAATVVTEQQVYEAAFAVASYSRNRGTKVGAVIYNPKTGSVICDGFNYLPKGLSYDDEAMHTAPLKGLVWEHAERSAIYEAAQYGDRLEGMGMGLTWYPCVECARAIVASGIETLVGLEPDWDHPKWGESHRAARLVLEAAGVKVTLLGKYQEQ